MTGANLNGFLRSLQIVKMEALRLASERAVQAHPGQLEKLLRRGNPVVPGPGVVAEDESAMVLRFRGVELSACFPLTPDGHLASESPFVFDESLAVHQVIALVEADIATEDKEEALASTWLGLGYHDHDHPADFGGIVLDTSRPGPRRPKCCYVDVKLTEALGSGAQRTKLEQRAQERKFGCMALTVTSAANNGFAGYPGRGLPGLLATVLHNPVVAGKNHGGYAVNWFFGISSNYQATQARWGWGGSRGVSLPEPLLDLLRATRVTRGQEDKSLLAYLEEYRDYSQFRDEKGDWDRVSLGATLKAKSIAARYLLMNEDPVLHAETTIANLTPPDAEEDMPLQLEDFHPGESFAAYYARRAVKEKRLRIEEERKANQAVRRLEEGMRKIDEERRLHVEEERKADEAVRLADEEKRKANEAVRLADEEKRLILELLQQGKQEEAMQLLAKGLSKATPSDPT